MLGKPGFFLAVVLASVLAAAASAVEASNAGAPALDYHVVLPALACHGCEEPLTPQAPVNARLLVERCGLDATCSTRNPSCSSR